MLWKLKGCPRCGGDMYLESDYYSGYGKCLQCGYVQELRSEAEFKRQAAERKKKPVLVS